LLLIGFPLVREPQDCGLAKQTAFGMVKIGIAKAAILKCKQ
jgi:hypothetical protein